MTKTISTRIAQKHDLEVNWLAFSGFVPMQGEIIIYDIEVDSTGKTLALPAGRTTPYTYERMKIGDGKTVVNALPFIVSMSELNDIELISINDIDTICGTVLQLASEVTF